MPIAPKPYNHIGLPPKDEPEPTESGCPCEVCGRDSYCYSEICVPDDRIFSYVCRGCWEAATDEQLEEWMNGY